MKNYPNFSRKNEIFFFLCDGMIFNPEHFRWCWCGLRLNSKTVLNFPILFEKAEENTLGWEMLSTFGFHPNSFFRKGKRNLPLRCGICVVTSAGSSVNTERGGKKSKEDGIGKRQNQST